MKSRSLVLALMMLVLAGKAHANPELNGLFDARSAGMGSTGVAFLDSAGAIPFNPALLGQVNNFALTLDLIAVGLQSNYPYPVSRLGPSGERYEGFQQVSSGRSWAALPFAAFAYRLSGRVAIGGAIYPTLIQADTGVRYRPAPDELPGLTVTNAATLIQLEASLPVSIRISDNFSLGISWRLTYLLQDISTTLPGAAPAGVTLDAKGNPSYLSVKLNGLNLSGVQLGLFYKPLPSLRLGLSYRSKVVVHATGTSRLPGAAMELNTFSDIPYPHAFRLGTALSVLQDTLLFAVDLKYLMYADAYKDLYATSTINNAVTTMATPYRWKDVFEGHFGIEYKMREIFSLRAGYILSTSATPEAYASRGTALPPGLIHYVTGGLGLQASDRWNVDFATFLYTQQANVYTATPNNAGRGRYSVDGIFFELSTTYRM